jgi:Protein of unknown function (DUF3179)
VFQRVIDGVELRFHLAGINNQNFVMRDEQTGSFWQQVNGLAISGPLAGKRLPLVFADEVTFGLWKAEQPSGSVLDDVPQYIHDYSPADWDLRMAKAPTVLSYAQGGLKPRDLMLGVHAFGASRAYRYDRVLKEQLIQDYIGDEPVLLIVGPDNRSVRIFRRRSHEQTTASEFYRIGGGGVRELFMDADTGSRWNFRGCAVAGKRAGVCLEPVNMIKDYWFDWRNYNPATTVYGVRQKIR